MHRRWPFTIAGGLIPTAAVALLAGGNEPAAPSTDAPLAALMQRKLELSQALLRSLALENYPRMAASSEQFLNLARQPWRVPETPEYRAQLKDFWTVLEGMQTAAADKNLDGTTRAYVQLTICCVKCHKSLWGTQE
jgi:hypothetical protein